MGGKQDIAANADNQGARGGTDARKRLLDTPAPVPDVVQVHGPRQDQVAVGIEAPDQRGTLVLEVALNLKKRAPVVVSAQSQGLVDGAAPKLAGHRLVALVGDYAEHPRQGQAIL